MSSAPKLSDIDLAQFIVGAEVPATEALCAQLAAAGARTCSMAFGGPTEEEVDETKLWQAARAGALAELSERALRLCEDSAGVVDALQGAPEQGPDAARAHERAVEHAFELLEISAGSLRLAAAGARGVQASCSTELGLGVITLGTSLRACLPLLEARAQELDDEKKAGARVAAARAVALEGAELERELRELLAITGPEEAMAEDADPEDNE